MIKNVKIKLVLSNTIFRVFSLINKIVPKDDKLILIYSNMEFRDNVKYIYDYMIQNQYNLKYKIVRSQNEKIRDLLPPNVSVVNNVKAIFVYLRAAHVYYAFGKLPIFPTRDQCVIQMWHGTPFKGFDNAMKYKPPSKSYYTYAFASSETFRPIVANLFGISAKHVVLCGQPRNDALFYNMNYNLNENYAKIIIWLPTFRKSTLLGYQDIGFQANIIPIFDNYQLYTLNKMLNELNVCLLIKLHPSQDLENYSKIDWENLKLFSHHDFNMLGWDLYNLLAQTDALITDYSAVAFDYLLLNRPIAYTVDDYEEYKDKRGFAVDNPEDFMVGPKLMNSSDFMDFIHNVVFEKDPWCEKRKEVNDIVNKYQDNNNRYRALKISGISV